MAVAAATATGALAVPLAAAQTASPETTSIPPAAHDTIASHARALALVALPQATEPAFAFKA